MSQEEPAEDRWWARETADSRAVLQPSPSDGTIECAASPKKGMRVCVCVCVCVCVGTYISPRGWDAQFIHSQHAHPFTPTTLTYGRTQNLCTHTVRTLTLTLHAHIRKTTRKHPRTRRGRYRPQMSPSLPSWIACSLLLFFCPSVFIVIVPDRTQTQKLCAGFFRDSTFRFLQSVPCGCMPLLCVRVCVCACVCCVDTSILVRGRGIKPLQS